MMYTTQKRNRRTQPVTTQKVVGWSLLILLIIVTLLPLVWAVRTALTPNSDIFSGDYSLIPENATLINFQRVLGMTTPEENIAAGGTAATINFWLYMRNSLLFVAVLVCAQVATSTMAAYALSRLHFRGRDTIFVTLLIALMIPPIFIALPNFVLMDRLAWINTFQGLLAPYVLICPFGIFFLRQFMLSLPREVEEAAMIDGSSRLGFFFRMVLPLSWPGVATVGILAFVASWNAYMLPLFLLNDSSKSTLPLGVQMFSSQHSVDTAQVLAFTALSMIPALICFTIFQKKIVGGLAGAVKG